MLEIILKVALCSLIYWVCATLGVPQPFLKIILVILVVIAILAVLSTFGLSISL